MSKRRHLSFVLRKTRKMQTAKLQSRQRTDLARLFSFNLCSHFEFSLKFILFLFVHLRRFFSFVYSVVSRKTEATRRMQFDGCKSKSQIQKCKIATTNNAKCNENKYKEEKKERRSERRKMFSSAAKRNKAFFHKIPKTKRIALSEKQYSQLHFVFAFCLGVQS